MARVHLPGELARDAEERRAAGAGAHEDRVEALAVQQLRDGEGLADHLVGLELDAHLAQALHLALDDVARQPERRDAVAEHAADHVQRLEHGDLGAEPDQVAGGGQPGRPGADDGHLARAAPRTRAGPRRRTGVVADETLEPADGHRLHLAVDDALAFALGFLRTHAAAHGREQIGFVDDRERAVEVAHDQVADEARDVDGHRAPGHARGLAALDAALRLVQGVLEAVAEVHLLEVGGALRRRRAPAWRSGWGAVP